MFSEITNNTINETIVNDESSETTKQTYLCVIMPAYNESKNIKSNLLYTSKTIGSFINNYQIIAVNDGSSDNTLDGIKEAASADSRIKYISYNRNRGKGYAISTGVKHADAEYIAFLDSDLELSPIMLRYFLKALQATGADIAIGSKLHKKSKLKYPLSRKIISYGYYLLLKLLFKLKIKDTQTGIKLFKAKVIKPICENLHSNGYAYDIEILATAAKQGYTIIEMPIELNYSRSKANKSTISIKSVIKVFKETLAVKRRISKL
ncbi:MAG: glycosyltransferase family 2 protein [Wujia sp.]